MRPPLERIMEGKSRRLTFQRRWMGLQKKGMELSILCGVETCLIVFAASSDDRPSEPLFWPPNPEHVRAIVRRYKEHGKGKGLMTKTLNSSKKGVSGKLGTEETEFPTVLDGRFDGLSVRQWKLLLKFWETRLEKVRSRIHQLRKMGRDEGLAMQNPSFIDIPTPVSTQVLDVPQSVAPAVDCSSKESELLHTSSYFLGDPSGPDFHTVFSPPSLHHQFLYDPEAASSSATLPPPPPQDHCFYEQPCTGMWSSSSSWPEMPPFDYYCFPDLYPIAAAPIQSLPLQMNTDGNETWEQYLRFD